MKAWRGRHILFLWLGTVGLGVALVVAESLRHRRFFWLVPVPANLLALPRVIAAAFTAFPFAATGVVLVPAIAIVLTACWMVWSRGSVLPDRPSNER